MSLYGKISTAWGLNVMNQVLFILDHNLNERWLLIKSKDETAFANFLIWLVRAHCAWYFPSPKNLGLSFSTAIPKIMLHIQTLLHNSDDKVQNFNEKVQLSVNWDNVDMQKVIKLLSHLYRNNHVKMTYNNYLFVGKYAPWKSLNQTNLSLTNK